MKLGLLTACLPDRRLEQIAGWAAANGYEALEAVAPHVDRVAHAQAKDIEIFPLLVA